MSDISFSLAAGILDVDETTLQEVLLANKIQRMSDLGVVSLESLVRDLYIFTKVPASGQTKVRVLSIESPEDWSRLAPLLSRYTYQDKEGVRAFDKEAYQAAVDAWKQGRERAFREAMGVGDSVVLNNIAQRRLGQDSVSVG